MCVRMCLCNVCANVVKSYRLQFDETLSDEMQCHKTHVMCCMGVYVCMLKRHVLMYWDVM